MTRPGAQNDQLPASSETARRAPLAAATAMGVMFAGAAFLVFAMSQSPTPIDPGTNSLAAVAALPDKNVPETFSTPSADKPAAEPDSVAPSDVAPAPETAPAPDNADASSQTVEYDLIPRLKPPQGERQATAASLTPAVMPLGQLFTASKDDRPTPIFFASDITPVSHDRAPLAVAYAGDINDGPRAFDITLHKGETFVDAMRRAGVRAEDRNNAAYAFGKYQNLRGLLPGQTFKLTTGSPNQTLFQIVANDHQPESYLLSLEYRPDATDKITLKRTADGGFAAQKSAVELTSRLVSLEGRIGGSLFLSAKHAGATDQVIADFANIFAYDVDFQREIFGGDEFEAIYQTRYDDSGALVETGDILYARLKWRGRTKEKEYYLFTPHGGHADYFDAAGHSAKRLLMKTPVDATRISSRFGTREHPILGYQRMHKGVDFAAPRGTPVKAAGDGVIERANRYGSFGNYIRIRHANGYQTIYGHLNGFARGIRAGKRVRQGQIIAYVGSTGRSTGPHLHYEVHHHGKPVNPMHLKIATGISLKGDDLMRFRAERDRIDAMRLKSEPTTPALLAQEGDDDKQL